eukprot:2824961-Prymnesium_polylepis.1
MRLQHLRTWGGTAAPEHPERAWARVLTRSRQAQQRKAAGVAPSPASWRRFLGRLTSLDGARAEHDGDLEVVAASAGTAGPQPGAGSGTSAHGDERGGDGQGAARRRDEHGL